MKILITGIHGFVGSNIVKKFKDVHQIYGLDIVSPVKDGILKTFSWTDLDHDVMPDFDVIIHLAGKAHDVKKQSGADVYFKVNTDLTKKIYDFFLNSTAKKFIFFSSIKAAADYVAGDSVDENVIPNPVGPYGESKIKAEEYIQSRWTAGDKQTIILRPCMIHGPGNKGNLNLLYSVVKKGIPWPLGAFMNKRSFTSIDNLLFIIDGLLNKDIKTGIYNVGDDTPLSTNELVALICMALGRKPHIWNLNMGVIRIISRIGTMLHLPFNSERLTKLTENYVVDNSKVKRAIGVETLPITSADGIISTIKSFNS